MTQLPPAPTGSRRAPAALVVAALAPLAIYYLLRPFTSDAVALACSAAIPVLGTLIAAATRRRTGPLALLAVVAFGAALAATVLEGGDTLPLKLYRPIATGVFGLACLISLAVHRPLLLMLAGRTARRQTRGGQVAAQATGSPGWRKLGTFTLVVGLTAVAEAAATTILALMLPTPTFLLVSRLVRWTILGIGVLVLSIVGRRRRTGDGLPTAERREPGEGKPWFRPRRYGIGRTPQTWQGWVVVGLVVAAIVAARLLMR
jgi:hypothetical protein